jgi:hypothetical protein
MLWPACLPWKVCNVTLSGVDETISSERLAAFLDPAVSSGPIVTACNDCLSMSIYFLIAISLTKFLL